MRSIFLGILALQFAALAHAAQIETTTTENGVLTRWSITTVGDGKKIRIDEGGFNATGVASATAAAGTGGVDVSYEKGPVRDTMIFDPDNGEMMSVEGKICRVLSSKSAPPPGMEFMNSPEMQAHQQEMAKAMAGRDKKVAEAIAQMKASGASQAQIDAMSKVLGGFDMATAPPNKKALEVERVDRNVSVGEFRADVYLARTAGGVDKYRFYMADVGDIPGGQDVRDGMVGMMETFAELMKQWGVGGVMDEAIVTIMTGPDFAGKYPVAIDDLQHNTHTEVVSARASAGNVDFSPDCEKRDMMSN